MYSKTIKQWFFLILLSGAIQGLFENGIFIVISFVILTIGTITPMLYWADELSTQKASWRIKHTLAILIILIVSSAITTGLAVTICYSITMNQCSHKVWPLPLVNLLVSVVPPMIRLLPQLEKSVNDENKLK